LFYPQAKGGFGSGSAVRRLTGTAAVVSRPRSEPSSLGFDLDLALGAAYTPLAIGPDGKVYTEDEGTLFVIGN